MLKRAACVFASLFALGCPQRDFAGDVLTSAAEVNALFRRTFSPLQDIVLTGRVTSVIHAKKFVLADATASTCVFDSAIDFTAAPGDLLVVRGKAGAPATDYPVPCFRELAFERLERGHPPAATPVTLADFADRRFDNVFVRVTCTVADVFTDEVDARTTILLLEDGHLQAIAVTDSCAPAVADKTALVGTRVELTGVRFANFDGVRSFNGPYLHLTALVVKAPPPDDPFSAPALPNLLRATPDEVAALGTRAISGTVLAVWRGNRLIVDTGNGFVVPVELSAGVAVPPAGTRIRSVGRAVTDLYHIALARATCRIEAPAPRVLPAAPAPFDLEKNLNSEAGRRFDMRAYGRLGSLRGIVRSVSSRGNGDGRVNVSCGPYLVPVDANSCPEILDSLAIGSVIEATGVWIVECENRGTNSSILPRINGAVVLLRRADDLRIVSTPSWWTAQRLLVVIATLVLALVIVGFWLVILNRLVERRGRELFKERIGRAGADLRVDERTRLAVELHDSLSQTLTGVSFQIDAAEKARQADDVSAVGHYLAVARQTLASCREELRNCLWDLRSRALEEADVATAIRRTVGPHLGTAALSVVIDVPRARLSDLTLHAILRIVRELAVNAVRHGGARHVTIAGTLADGALGFTVTDDGCGFDPAAVPGPLTGHFGLQGIGERLRTLGGQMEITSRPGTGTTVRIVIGT